MQIKNELSWQKYFYHFSFLRLKWQQFKIYQQPYVSDVPCEFITLQNHAEINLKKEILVRDGALGLFHFFKHTPPKSIRTQLIISRKFRHLVPKIWQQNISLYHLYCTTTRQADLPVLVYGIPEGLPKQFILKLKSLNQQGEIALWLANDNSKKKLPAVQTGQAIVELSLHLRTADSYVTHKLLSQRAALYLQEPTLSPSLKVRKIPVSPYHGFTVTPYY